MSLLQIDGYAVVSDDGMIAGNDGKMPDAIKTDADQKFYFESLQAADVLVHGRHSEEDHPKSEHRRRIILTHKVQGVERAPGRLDALLWNPATEPFERALELLSAAPQRIAIIGGTSVFGLFLTRYTAFFLSRVARVRLPGGLPVFPQVPMQTPEDVLRTSGLSDGGLELSEPSQNLTVRRWIRGSDADDSKSV